MAGIRAGFVSPLIRSGCAAHHRGAHHSPARIWGITKRIDAAVGPPRSTPALPSFTQHLAVVEGAGLVPSDKPGRTRTYRLAPSGLNAAEGRLAGQRHTWQQRLAQLDQFLIDQKESP